MDRRNFLVSTGKTLAFAASTTAIGVLFHNRQVAGYEPIILKTSDFTVPADKNLPQVALSRKLDPAAALRSSLDGVGGIKRFIRKGDKVTIKPNIGWDRTPEQGADTNPVLVGEMVRLCLVAGAAQVIVTDIPCNEARRCFLRSGIRAEAEKAGAKVILPLEEDYVRTVMGGQALDVWPVLKYFVQTDRLINMPIAKHHSLSEYTGAMKNFYGILGGRRNQLHQKIDQSIVDLAAFCKPTLTVIDCTRVLLRGGPTGGSLEDVAIENTVICATDQVAADSRAVEFLSLKGDQVGHIVLAEKSGLGKVDYRAAGYKEIG
jgi:uncharacterized protein (DUF362 family)